MIFPEVTLINNTEASIRQETLTQASVSLSSLGTVTDKQVRSAFRFLAYFCDLSLFSDLFTFKTGIVIL